MDQNQNPIDTRGFRNVFCPYYGSCLDHAIENHWEYWACFECHHKREQILITELFISKRSADQYYSLSPSFYEKAKDFSF